MTTSASSSRTTAPASRASPDDRALASLSGSLLPVHASAGEQVANAAQDAKSVAGTYWLSRRSQTNIVAVTSALDQVDVSVNSDGTISLNAVKDFAGNPKHFKEIAPMMFREVYGQSLVASPRITPASGSPSPICRSSCCSRCPD